MSHSKKRIKDLPEFKIGDVIKDDDNNIYEIVSFKPINGIELEENDCIGKCLSYPRDLRVINTVKPHSWTSATIDVNQNKIKKLLKVTEI